MRRSSSLNKVFPRAEKVVFDEYNTEKEELISKSPEKVAWPRRAARSLRGCFTMCWGYKEVTLDDDLDDLDDDCEPLLGERAAYVPKHARASFLKTTASRGLQRANRIL